MQPADDVNGDQVPDFLVGDPDYPTNYLIFGTRPLRPVLIDAVGTSGFAIRLHAFPEGS